MSDIICYSYMTPKALGQLLSTGSAYGDDKYVEKEFIDAYKWMRNQMKIRLGNPSYTSAYPVWVWVTWEGNNKYPPISGFTYERMDNPGGLYRVTLSIPEEKILLSNFDTWHAVLTNNYLYETDEELSKDDYALCEKEKSWQKIFDIEKANTLWGPSTLSIQGTVWEITDSMIVKVEHFPHMKPTKNFLKNKEFWDKQ